MKFLVLSFTVLVTLLSCAKESRLVVFDSYYDSFYSLSENDKYDYISIGFNELSTLDLHEYKAIITSPLLYRLNRAVWDQYEGKLKILEPSIDFDGDTLLGVRVSNVKSYKDIYNNIKSGEIRGKVEKICFIYDGYKASLNLRYPSYEIPEAQYLVNKLRKNKEVIEMKVDESTSVADIENFITNNNDIDLWIINSDTYSLTIYELINIEESVIINENSFFNEKNRNIIYTIDKDLEKNIDIVLENSVNEIYSVLKSY